MKKLVFSILIISTQAFSEKISDKDVKVLVENTCIEIQGSQKIETVLNKISKGLHPYKDKKNEAFYVFVYDEKINIVAHPKKALVGKNYHNKPDVRGKMFRNMIVNGALKKKTGWIPYAYQKPGAKGIHRKKSYYKLCPHNDINYIVVSGKYM